MAKAKRISVNALDGIIKETFEPVVTVEWHGQDLMIKRALSFQEMMLFVSMSTDACFHKDGTYMPEKLWFAVKTCMINMYTNVTLPESVEKQYAMVYASDLTDVILANICKEQFNEMFEAINARIKYRINTRVEEVNRHISEMYNALDSLEKKFSGTLKDVSSKDLKAIIGAMTEGGFDEEKLVRSYIDAKKAK